MLEENHHKVARCTGGKATHSSTIKHGNFICENEFKKKTVKKKRQYQSLPNSITWKLVFFLGSDGKRKPMSDMRMHLISIKNYFKDILQEQEQMFHRVDYILEWIVMFFLGLIGLQ